MANLAGIGKIKENIISLAIVMLAFFIAVKVYQNKDKDIQAIRSQKGAEERKSEILSEISTLEKRLDYLDKNVNNKDIAGVLDRIGDAAKASSVKIIRINPQKEMETAVYVKHPYDLALSADNYHYIGKFISSLENSPDSYMVENLRINSGAGSEAGTMSAALTVSTITIKNKK